MKFIWLYQTNRQVTPITENSFIDKVRFKLNNEDDKHEKEENETCNETKGRLSQDFKTILMIYKIQRSIRTYLAKIKTIKKSVVRYVKTNETPEGKFSSLIQEKKFTSNFTEGIIKYVGEMVGQIREGFGIQTWMDGAQYIGQWKKHKASGQGVFHHSDGDVYIGY